MNIKKILLLILCSVVLLSIGWLRVSGFTLLAALVPLLFISHSYDSSYRSFWRMTGWVVLTFWLWSLATLWWIWFAEPMGVVASTTVQAILFGTVFMIYHYVSKRCRPALANVILVCGWIGAEYLYLNGELSFPWLLLGNGFANDPWAVQWYEYTGVLGGSLWVLVSNLLIFNAIICKNKKWWIRAAFWIGVPLLFSTVIYFTWKEPTETNVTVTAIQPNIDTYTEKFNTPQAQLDSIMLSLAYQAPENVDFLLLPETSVSDNIWESNLEKSMSLGRFRNFIRQERPDAQFIIGASTYKQYRTEIEKTETARETTYGMWYDVFNSAISVDSTGLMLVRHKGKLLIGVEKVPYKSLLEPIIANTIDQSNSKGYLGKDNHYHIFKLPRKDGSEISSATLICYESVYGEHFARFAAKGAQIIFVITNDGWWRNTPGHKQHFSFSRLRAIETRRYVVRSANTGISGFISPRGEVLDKLGWDKRGVVTRTVSLSDKVTLYSEYGDVLGRISYYIFSLSILYYIVYRFRRKSHLVK